ncbi:MAG: hypothetical protein Ct9H90mP14_1210 [Methanobacteriota archaeon]|nr:MAG: hypothetical protein Ct9H90mP14_1210 [Euryarchaeota archaeon]
MATKIEVGCCKQLAAVEVGADVIHGTALGWRESRKCPLDQTLVNLSLMGLSKDLTALKNT